MTLCRGLCMMMRFRNCVSIGTLWSLLGIGLILSGCKTIANIYPLGDSREVIEGEWIGEVHGIILVDQHGREYDSLFLNTDKKNNDTGYVLLMQGRLASGGDLEIGNTYRVEGKAQRLSPSGLSHPRIGDQDNILNHQSFTNNGSGFWCIEVSNSAKIEKNTKE